ncbi:MAG: polyprenyl synthetase family protein [Roseburia sp.]|nr:polyprenyl synthetase family protein [Roseburia sp.]
MNALEAIRNTIAPELEQLNTRIEQALASENALMRQVVEGYLKSKGKLIRPILVILTAKLFGEVNDRVIASASAVEMLHNASLIHDDVVDDSRTRRGRPTVNSVWDNHIAVLVGDFFVSNALQQAISTTDIRIVDSLANLGKLLSLGEIDQIYNARYHCLDEKAYFEVISRKTASLFVSCVKMGAYSVGEDSERLQDMCRFAELLGLCFQIKDDIFDYFEDEKIGKPTGNDLREGKITLPLLYALNRKDMPEHDEMLTLSRNEELDATDIGTLIEYAKRAGGIDYAYDVMARFRDEALLLLEPFGHTDTTRAFHDIFDYIIVRDK